MAYSLFAKKDSCANALHHETKRKVVFRFLFVLIIFLSYLTYIVLRQGLQQGMYVAILSWSFFVLSTPVADAGFLIDFPLRLVTNIKMIISEACIWIFAISINAYSFFIRPDIYESTGLLKIFKRILAQPFPYWTIILLSMIGTFVSIRFGDELLDTYKYKERSLYNQHKNKHKFIIMMFLFAMTFTAYKFLLSDLGVTLPL